MSPSSQRFIKVAVLLATGGLLYYLGTATTGMWDADPEGTQTANNAEPKILYWRAPMDPNEIYDKPGKSRMGMDLIPVHEGAAGSTDSSDDAGIVRIDPVALQKINFSTAPVTVEHLTPKIRTTGRFFMDERGRTSISLKVEGWIQELHVNFDGAIVKDGQPVLDLYSPAIVATQEEYLLALANMDRLRGTTQEADARRLVEATRRRLAYWDVSEEQVQQISESRTVLPSLTFYAPHGGEVMQLNVAEGQYIPAGHRLMDIVDISNIWLIVDLYDEDLSRISVGSKAQIEVRSDPGRQFTGRVDYIYHMMNDELRTARARIVLPGRHGGPLKPGMYATAFLEASTSEAELVIPESALIRTGQRNLVIVALGSGRFRPQSVDTGLSAEGKIQVLSGLEEGDLVVVNAQFLIDSEAGLTGVVASMSGGGMEETGETDRMEGMEGMENVERRTSNVERRTGMDDMPGVDSMKNMEGMEGEDEMPGMDSMKNMEGMEGMDDMPGMDGTKRTAGMERLDEAKK
ncbi:MAG TPA: efflux RND transporter periplasmic adaptor subunit [Rhodothermales bacterium]